MFANFSWFWKHKYRHCFLFWCIKMQIKNVQHSLNIAVCTSFHPPISSSFHLPSSVIYSMLNQCKKSYIIDNPSCIYCRSSVESLTYLCVSHAQCVMSYLFQQQQARVTIRSMLLILSLLDQGIMYHIDIHLITRYMCKLDMTMYSVKKLSGICSIHLFSYCFNIFYVC